MDPTHQDIQELRNEFNQRAQDENKEFHPKDMSRVNSDDNWLKRFLVHNDLDKEEALKMLLATCEWRKSQKVNELTEFNVNREYLTAGSLFIHSTDKDGKPLFILRSAMHYKNAVDFEELKRCIIYWFERAERMENVDQITVFFDMVNSGISNLDTDYTKYLISLFKLYYPNFLNYILIFEMPWVLNAAFKIIKSWLPTKAVQKIKFVTTSSLKNYVDPSHALESWGGTDPYKFTFESESSPTEWPKTDENKKKVHFANSQSPEVGDSNSFYDDAGRDTPANSTKVRLTPSDAITFAQEGIEVSGSVMIANTSEGTIAYKVKTTSPDKFRVRPSSGALGPGKSIRINVVLLSEYNMTNIAHAKFLVMTVPMDRDNPSINQINEAWKTKDAQKAEQFRLKCQAATAPATSNTQHFGPVGSPPATDVEQKISQLLLSMNHVSETCSEIQAELKTAKQLIFALIAVSLSLGATVVYLLLNLSSSDSDQSHSEL